MQYVNECKMYMQLPIIASITQSRNGSREIYVLVLLAHCSEQEQKCYALHRLYATEEGKGNFASLAAPPDIRLLL